MSEKSVAKRRYTNEFRLRPSGLPKQPCSMKRRPGSGGPVARSSTEREGASERGPRWGGRSDSLQASWQYGRPPASCGNCERRGARCARRACDVACGVRA